MYLLQEWSGNGTAAEPGVLYLVWFVLNKQSKYCNTCEDLRPALISFVWGYPAQ